MAISISVSDCVWVGIPKYRIHFCSLPSHISVFISFYIHPCSLVRLSAPMSAILPVCAAVFLYIWPYVCKSDRLPAYLYIYVRTCISSSLRVCNDLCAYLCVRVYVRVLDILISIVKLLISYILFTFCCFIFSSA